VWTMDAAAGELQSGSGRGGGAQFAKRPRSFANSENDVTHYSTLVCVVDEREFATPCTKRRSRKGEFRSTASRRRKKHCKRLSVVREDAALLTAISNPNWMIKGLRNRDLVSMLYSTDAEDPQERRRRSNRVTRLLRLLRAHGLLEKIPRSHRYEVSAEARTRIQALLACRNANPDQLI